MTVPLAADALPTTAIEKRPLERYVAPATPSLVGLSRAELAEALGAAGVPERQRRMRAQQIWHWLYVRGAQDFDAMTTLSKELRAELALHFTLARPEIAAEQISVDGTRKWLIRLPGEVADRPHEVECVYIPETDRGTLCISSQVGCTLNCSFCQPARSVWCATSRRARLSARWCWRATGSAIGSARRPPAPNRRSGSSPMW